MTMTQELFPHSDETGNTEWRDGCEIVAYDYDGDRYCVDCAAEMDEIERARFHFDPYSVPAGGSVERRHMRETDHEYHCGNPRCGRKIPE